MNLRRFDIPTREIADTTSGDWRPIGNGYLVSNEGKITRNGLLINQRKNCYGYWTVWVDLGDGFKKRSVHSLVTLAFHGKPQEGQWACHRDDDKDNNRPNNLYWGTPKTNGEDRVRNGRQAVGERAGLAKFSEQTVRRIRNEYAAGVASQEALAQKYGTSQSHVSRIVRREVWGCVS